MQASGLSYSSIARVFGTVVVAMWLMYFTFDLCFNYNICT